MHDEPESLKTDDEQNAETTHESFDVHDLEKLKKLWFLLRDTQKSEEVFALTQLLLASLPYDWINPQNSWLHIAEQLEQHGETELASLFKLANQRAFQLSLKGL